MNKLCEHCGTSFERTNETDRRWEARRWCCTECYDVLRAEGVLSTTKAEDPTPEEIEQRTAEIRARWSHSDLAKRIGAAPAPVEAQVVSMRDLVRNVR